MASMTIQLYWYQTDKHHSFALQNLTKIDRTHRFTDHSHHANISYTLITISFPGIRSERPVKKQLV